MAEFNISPYTLREHLAMLQELDKKVYIINGLFDNPEKEKPELKKEGILGTLYLIMRNQNSPC